MQKFNLTIFLLFSFVFTQPNWDCDSDGIFDVYANYQYPMSITVLLDHFDWDITSTSEEDMLAAFVDGELRGIATPTLVPFGPYQGSYMFLIQVYSNLVEGETIYFQYYDIESDYTFGLLPVIGFISDGIIGNLMDPLIITMIEQYQDYEDCYENDNDAPVAYEAEYTLDEDNQINIYLSATDENGDALTYAIVDSPNNGLLELEEASATYMPNVNFNGDDSFSFTVNDGEFSSNEATISLVVNAVNDAPYIDSIPDATIDSNNIFMYELEAYDVDGDELTYAASIDGNGTVALSNNMLAISPDENFSGIIEVAVVVSDGIATDSSHFTLTVYISGCTGPDSCNYNPYATVDDGSCVYPNYWYDCYGNCMVEIDCTGVCGGSATIDECGVCNGDSTSCEYPGDLNGDGNINVVDVVILVDLIINESYSILGDVNGDGNCNVVDVVILIDWILG